MEDSVPGEVLFAHKRFSALVALKWFGTLVDVFDMHWETHSSIERLVANVASEPVLAGVVEDVAAQLASLDEALATVATRVRLHTSVRLDVPIQSLLGSKLSKALEHTMNVNN